MTINKIGQLSIIIPSYNSAAMLKKLLHSIFQSNDVNCEIIVVDDCSTDQTIGMLAAFPKVTILKLDRNSGPAFARNEGVRMARGDIILFLDADVIVHPDTLAQTVDFFAADPTRRLMTGIYSPNPANSGMLPRYKALQCLSYYESLPVIAPISVFWTGVAAIRRQTFNELGGFDAAAYKTAGLEDVEFGRRAGQCGHQIYLNKSVVVDHHFPQSLTKNFRDHYQRGFQWALLKYNCAH